MRAGIIAKFTLVNALTKKNNVRDGCNYQAAMIVIITDIFITFDEWSYVGVITMETFYISQQVWFYLNLQYIEPRGFLCQLWGIDT